MREMTNNPSQSVKAKMNWITLSFPENLEKIFQEEYFNKSLRHVQIALLLALFLYDIFGFLDHWIVPEEKTKLWFIRYAIFSPCVLTVFLFSYSSWFKSYMQPLIAFVFILAGLGITVMMIIAPYPMNYLYYGGLLLVFFYCYAFLKLRFIWATISGWTILMGYEIGAIWLTHTTMPIIINHNFFFITGNLIGMFVCYSIERYTRNDFVQRSLLNLEKNRVHQANYDLEYKVKKRTSLLLKINDELKREIVERNQVENRLKESEERYRTIVETIEEGYYEVDINGQLTFLNDSMCKILDHPQEECVGHHLKTFTDKKNTRKGYRAFQQVYQNGVPLRDFKWDIKRKNGTVRHLDASVSLIRDSNGNRTGFRGITRDITEQIRAHEALARSKLEAEAANQAKSEFLASMSHELRTPLNHIIGFTELLIDKIPGDLTKVQEEYLNDVYQSSHHLLDVINDILDLSKVEAGRQELNVSDVNIRELLENSLLMIKEKTFNHGIALEQNFDGIPKTIRADERKLKQVLYNLLANAAKFTPDGGIIELIARCREKKGNRNEGKKYIEISVRDSGIGLKKQDQDRIFNSFEQVDNSTSRRFQGTGLGLSIVKSLIELHGGKIWAESEGKDKGSNFIFLIPIQG